MKEYRILPHGGEKICTLGLGMGGIQSAAPDEIEAVIRRAIENGINFFDLCAGGASVYAPFGRAIKGMRDKIFFQLHFGAVYNADGEYGWSRDLAHAVCRKQADRFGTHRHDDVLDKPRI